MNEKEAAVADSTINAITRTGPSIRDIGIGVSAGVAANTISGAINRRADRQERKLEELEGAKIRLKAELKVMRENLPKAQGDKIVEEFKEKEAAIMGDIESFVKNFAINPARQVIKNYHYGPTITKLQEAGALSKTLLTNEEDLMLAQRGLIRKAPNSAEFVPALSRSDTERMEARPSLEAAHAKAIEDRDAEGWERTNNQLEANRFMVGPSTQGSLESDIKATKAHIATHHTLLASMEENHPKIIKDLQDAHTSLLNEVANKVGEFHQQRMSASTVIPSVGDGVFSGKRAVPVKFDDKEMKEYMNKSEKAIKESAAHIERTMKEHVADKSRIQSSLESHQTKLSGLTSKYFDAEKQLGRTRADLGAQSDLVKQIMSAHGVDTRDPAAALDAYNEIADKKINRGLAYGAGIAGAGAAAFTGKTLYDFHKWNKEMRGEIDAVEMANKGHPLLSPSQKKGLALATGGVVGAAGAGALYNHLTRHRGKTEKDPFSMYKSGGVLKDIGDIFHGATDIGEHAIKQTGSYLKNGEGKLRDKAIDAVAGDKGARTTTKVVGGVLAGGAALAGHALAKLHGGYGKLLGKYAPDATKKVKGVLGLNKPWYHSTPAVVGGGLAVGAGTSLALNRGNGDKEKEGSIGSGGLYLSREAIKNIGLLGAGAAIPWVAGLTVKSTDLANRVMAKQYQSQMQMNGGLGSYGNGMNLQGGWPKYQ